MNRHQSPQTHTSLDYWLVYPELSSFVIKSGDDKDSSEQTQLSRIPFEQVCTAGQCLLPLWSSNYRDSKLPLICPIVRVIHLLFARHNEFLFLHTLSHQLYFFFKKEILELLTKALHKYRVMITLLRTLRGSILCLHVLSEWHSQWEWLKSASSAPGLGSSKTIQKMLKVWKVL